MSKDLRFVTGYPGYPEMLGIALNLTLNLVHSRSSECMICREAKHGALFVIIINCIIKNFVQFLVKVLFIDLYDCVYVLKLPTLYYCCSPLLGFSFSNFKGLKIGNFL